MPAFDLVVVDDTAGLLGNMSAGDRAATIRETLRLLRPGGRALVIGSAPRQRSGRAAGARSRRPALRCGAARCEPTASKAFATSPNAMGWCSSKGSSPGRNAGWSRTARATGRDKPEHKPRTDCPARSTPRLHALVADRKFCLEIGRKTGRTLRRLVQRPGQAFCLVDRRHISASRSSKRRLFGARDRPGGKCAGGARPRPRRPAHVRAVRRSRSHRPCGAPRSTVETPGIGALFSIFSAAGARSVTARVPLLVSSTVHLGLIAVAVPDHDVRHNANRDTPGRRRTHGTGAPGVLSRLRARVAVAAAAVSFRRRRHPRRFARDAGSQQSGSHSRTAPAN